MNARVFFGFAFFGIFALSGCDNGQRQNESAVSPSPSATSENLPAGGSATAIASVTKNVFEDAIDPFTGSREKWSQFTDNGGLNSQNDFYGMPVQGISVQWTDGKTVRMALMTVSKSVSPKQIREALNKSCQTAEADWQRQDGALTKGEVHNGKIKCDYLTNDSASNYDVAISVE